VVTSAGAIFVVPIARSKKRRALAGDLHRRLVDLPAISN
jgi:hypothetical protein